MSDEQLAQATATLESFLIRRMVCRRTTKDYNRVFLDALQELEAGHPVDAGDRLTAFFARQTADARLWPADTDVARAVVTSPMYHHLKRSRLKMLLEVLENDLRTDRSEERFSPSTKITIQHIIPQAWTPLTWPLEVPDDHVPPNIDWP